MAKNKSAWGIEIGAHAIKAVRLELVGDEAAITDFAYIPHNKPLTTPDLDVAEMTRLTMGQLVASKNLEDQKVVISVPGHSALARFAKLPPVEPKMIPNIVKFEAVQQIPFPIEEVEWDYQTFASPENPEVEVGIFAITKERIDERLKLYAEYGIRPEIVTLGPLAVFNAVSYDLALESEHKPVVVLDIGTQASDVIIADNSRCWIRTFPLGGTHFTETLLTAFQISYGKADRLKAESATSKYARQMMQAMRPVFGDLVQEVQRSIGHYQTNHRESPLATVLAVGSTFRIPGLRKFLGQQLSLEINRMDEFKRIRIEGREAADFLANSINFVTSYGLALQGIGLSRISINLAPVRGLREKIWSAKNRWFIGAASIALIGAAAMYISPILEQTYLDAQDVSLVSSIIKNGEQLQSQLTAADAVGVAGAIASNMEQFINEDRKVWPCLVNDVVESTLAANPTEEITSTDAAKIAAIPAKDRKRIVLESLVGKYKYDETAQKRTILVTMNVEFANSEKKTFLKDTIQKWLCDNSDRGDKVPYIIVADSVALKGELISRVIPGGAATSTTPANPSSNDGANSKPPSDPTSSPDGSSADETKTATDDANLSSDETNQAETKAGPTAETSNADLDRLAPIGDEPGVYGPGMSVYRGTIVFTVEIRSGAVQKATESKTP